MSNSVFVKRVSVLFITENIIYKSKDKKTPERDNNKKSQTHRSVKELGRQKFSLVDEQSSTHSLQ